MKSRKAHLNSTCLFVNYILILFLGSQVLVTAKTVNWQGPGGSKIKEIRYFFLVLLFILAARALATPGAPVVQFGVISVTRDGLVDGMMVCWRLISDSLVLILS